MILDWHLGFLFIRWWDFNIFGGFLMSVQRISCVLFLLVLFILLKTICAILLFKLFKVASPEILNGGRVHISDIFFDPDHFFRQFLKFLLRKSHYLHLQEVLVLPIMFVVFGFYIIVCIIIIFGIRKVALIRAAFLLVYLEGILSIWRIDLSIGF